MLPGIWKTVLAGLSTGLIGIGSCFGGVGCSNAEKFAQSLTFLQQGKAEGEITLVTDGRVGGSMETNFSGGMNKSTLSFHGKIDFADSVRHVSGGDDSP